MSYLSNEVHALRSWSIETLFPNGKVKAGASPAANVGICQTLIEVKTGTGANDLIQYRSQRETIVGTHRDSHLHLREKTGTLQHNMDRS
jgi:hypothetical protein